jgi:hypothetical protein
MLDWEIVTVGCGIHTKQINSICVKNVEFFNDKPSGTYSYHWALVD